METTPPANGSAVPPEPQSSNEQNEENVGTQDAPVAFHPGARFYLAFSSLTVLAMMVSLDGTSVSVALPIIASSLHGTAIEAFWAGTAFLLSSAVFQLPIASLSTIFGRMPLLTLCAAAFLVGIIVSARATDFAAMLAGRTVQGVGGGGIILMNDLLITDLVPLRQRGRWFGVIGGVWALGSISGPIVGGSLAFKADWVRCVLSAVRVTDEDRWIFEINIPFGVISLVMVPLFIRLQTVPGSLKEKLLKIDWAGIAFFIAAATSFLIPLTWGGVQYAWSSWRTLIPLILGTAGLIAFAVFERFVPTFPIFRSDLVFGNYNMAYCLFATLINALIVYGLLYFLPLYYEGVQGYTPIVSGVAMFPSTFTAAPFAIIAGIVVEKTGDFKYVTIFGWVLVTLGMGIMILLDVGTTIVQWVFLTFCSGTGLGLLYTSLAFVNQSATDDNNMTFAVGMFIFARSLGQCLGVAICGVIFQNRMFANLQNYPDLAGRASEYSRDASSLVLTLKGMSDGAQKQELLQAYADSLQTVWLVMCILSGVAMIGSFFVKRVSLDRELDSEQKLQASKQKGEKGAMPE
ncbi:MAG: hypothetical protein Q9165_002417 [Trypethelium subeluteriae]